MAEELRTTFKRRFINLAPGDFVSFCQGYTVFVFRNLYFVKWAGLEIPSEWWWEKAARGTDADNFPWGNSFWGWHDESFAHVDEENSTSEDAYSDIRTAYGCEQMVGNVSEFCLSFEGHDETQIQSKSGLHLPTPEPEKVEEDQLVALRGSCYLRTTAKRMVCSHRLRLSAGRRNSWTGLRVAWSDQK